MTPWNFQPQACRRSNLKYEELLVRVLWIPRLRTISLHVVVCRELEFWRSNTSDTLAVYRITLPTHADDKSNQIGCVVPHTAIDHLFNRDCNLHRYRHVMRSQLFPCRSKRCKRSIRPSDGGDCGRQMKEYIVNSLRTGAKPTVVRLYTLICQADGCMGFRLRRAKCQISRNLGDERTLRIPWYQ
ncbi:hypothetical protein PHMEG_00018036 [Phytophthora megakarya]|uniref:Uncharacterized protein n=1 Tax=Phytophthora megakarya TaxID=4795 RepID=A0A225VVB0_9STRA|nr:hypothetical protein PHMEG_00018036 [Phytophthora megakarya]